MNRRSNRNERKERLIVLVDIYHLYIAETGIKSYIQNFIQMVENSEDKLHAYHFVPSLKKVKKQTNFRKRNLVLVRLLGQLEGFLWKQLYMPFKCLIMKPDVVFFPDYYAPFYKLKAKKLVMFHDTFFWDTPQHYGRLWLKYFLWATKMGLRGNSSVFTITQFSKQKIGKIISPAIPIDFQHHPALQLWTSERLNTGILEGFDLKKNKYFLHVGVFEKRKDLPLLVEAFSQFKMLNKVHDYKLVLVGKRAPNKRFDDFHLIKSRIEKEPALAKDVILAGYLSKDKVQDLYQNALSYVFPSNNEGFGFPIIESYINNCPVIVSNQGALTEVAGEAALTFKVGDLDDLVSQMSRIYLEPELREILIKNGKERLSLFEPRAYFNQFERYLTKMA